MQEISFLDVRLSINAETMRHEYSTGCINPGNSRRFTNEIALAREYSKVKRVEPGQVFWSDESYGKTREGQRAISLAIGMAVHPEVAAQLPWIPFSATSARTLSLKWVDGGG